VKRVWSLVALGATAYLLFLLLSSPATRLVPLLERQVPGLSLRAVTGSVFSGQAMQLVYQGVDFGQATWRFRPGALLQGRLEYRVDLTDPANPGHAHIGITPLGHVRGQDIEFLVPADRLVNQYSPWRIQTSGEMRVRVDSVASAANFPEQLAGLISWNDAVVLTPVDLVLGDVSMALHTEEGALVGSILNGGRLETEGEIRLFPDGRYQLNLRLQPDNQMSDETLVTLQSAGQMQADGDIVFKYSGRL